ncbi:MAG: hypothetical protein K6B65_06895 [Bacilli bacterium]|nr:hypothetical protein [Bacilli bacterium]
MNVSLFVIGGAISLFGLLAFLILGLRSYSLKKRANNKRYDILTDFPFELYDGYPPISLLSRAGFIFFQASFVFLGLSALSIDIIQGFKSYLVFLIVCLALKGIFYSGLLFIPASNEKLHVSFALTSFLLEALCTFMAGLFFFQFSNVYSPAFGWVFSLICWVITAAMVFISLNPRLMKWAKMNVVEDMDGSHLERPRPFVLAFSEWGAYIIDSLFFLLLLVSLIFGFTL